MLCYFGYLFHSTINISKQFYRTSTWSFVLSTVLLIYVKNINNTLEVFTPDSMKNFRYEIILLIALMFLLILYIKMRL